MGKHDNWVKLCTVKYIDAFQVNWKAKCKCVSDEPQHYNVVFFPLCYNKCNNLNICRINFSVNTRVKTLQHRACFNSFIKLYFNIYIQYIQKTSEPVYRVLRLWFHIYMYIFLMCYINLIPTPLKWAWQKKWLHKND